MIDFFDTETLNSDFVFEALSTSSNDYLFFGNLQTNEYRVSSSMFDDFDLPGLVVHDLASVWGSLVDDRDRVRYDKSLEDVLTGKVDTHDAEYQIQMRDGTYVWVHCRGSLLRDRATQKALWFIGCVQNLEKSGTLDRTTGLSSYDKCRRDLDQLLDGRGRDRGGILLLGIDGFSEINLTNDHLFGDAVLHHTAQDILRLLPEKSSIYRYEGDQFIVVFRDAERQDLSTLYNEIKHYATQSHDVDGRAYHFTFSGGVAMYPEDGDEAADLVKNASLALRKAKKNGRNCCVFFRSDLFQQEVRKRALRKLLSESAESRGCEGFFLVYQPIVDAETLTVVGVESLVRFESSEFGTLTPEDILPVLESTELIVPVGAWILEQTLAVCAPWMAQIPNLVVNVNVSHIQFRDQGFCSIVEKALHRHGVDSSCLLLDLPEDRFVFDSEVVEMNLRKLHVLGAKVSMDDFGTGCSSLGRLASYDVDVLKIDPVFVESLDESGYNHDFIEAVIRLCHNIGMSVCVEGIETAEDCMRVQRLGADYVQGNFVTKPLLEQDFFNRFILGATQDRPRVVSESVITQKKLVGDKALLRLIMDATPLCMTLMNSNFECIECNHEAVRLLGARDRQHYLDNFLYISPERQPDGSLSAKRAPELIALAFEQGACQFRWIHRTFSGEDFPVEVNLMRLSYQNEYVVVGFARDLRPQMLAEQSEKRASERVKMLLDASPLFVSLWDREFRNIECNQEALNLFGIKDKQTYLDQFYDLSPKYQPDGSLTSDKICEALTKTFEEGYNVIQWMHCTLTGEPIPSEVTLVRLMYQNEYVVAGYTRDMRPQLEAERSVKESAHRVNAIVRALPLSSMFWGSDGELIECNEQTIKMFNAADEDEVKRLYYRELLPKFQPDGRTSNEKLGELIRGAKDNGRSVSEWMYRTVDGEEIPSELTLVLIRDEGDSFQIASYCRDLRELQATLEINRRLQQLAYFDSLTGASSRSKFMQQVENRMSALREGDTFGLAMFDFDRFKDVNDTYGHKAGDITLQTIVDYIAQALPEDGFVGRYGGDEFMLQPGSMSSEEFAEWAERLLQDISDLEIFCEGQVLHQTVSMGCCFWDSRCSNNEALLAKADVALYEAKNAGRNRFVVTRFSDR